MTALLLDPARACVLLVDFQERFAGAVEGFGAAADRARILARGARILDLPVAFSEQYPQGLGHTVKAVSEELAGIEPVEKTSFSVARHPLFPVATDAQVILCGVEAHVCVAQTGLELIDRGVGVFVATDAVASRNPAERDVGLRRLELAGAVTTTVEAALFELVGDSAHPRFREIQELIK